MHVKPGCRTSAVFILLMLRWTIRLHQFLANVNYATFAICHRSSVCCLSVCDVGAPYSAGLNFRHFFSPYDSSGTLVFWCQKSLVGTPLSPEICVQSDQPPFKQRNFDQYRLIVPQPWWLAKKVQLALIGSRPRAFQRAIDEPCTLPLSPPKGGTKTRYRCLCQ